MKPETIERLRAGRQLAADHLQALVDLPEAERPTKPAALKAWLRGLENHRGMVEQFDKLIARMDPPKRAKPVRTAAPAPAPADEASDRVVLARIPKTKRAELRVTVHTWRGRRVVDIRTWALIDGGTEPVPSRKGISIDAGNLPAIIEALHLARQHA